MAKAPRERTLESTAMRTGFLLGIGCLLAALTSGCGGGGEGDAPPLVDPNRVGAGWITIDASTPQESSTDSVSIAMSGEAFINPSCAINGCGDPINTGVEVTWINSTNGTSGSARQDFRVCFFLLFFLCDHHWTASIPLALGSNNVRITAADAFGNVGTVTRTIQRVPDVTAPTVIATSPAKDAQGVPVNATLSVRFSEPMDPTSLNGTTFVLLDSSNNAVPGAVSVVGPTAILDPAGFLSTNSTYSARITTAARDIVGNPLTNDVVWTFSTGAPVWLTTSTINAPGYPFHTVVWTGSQMIVWGQSGSGASYDPAANAWKSISQTGAPSGHTHAVWTGSEMLIWNSKAGNGGRYDPATDAWRPISTMNAPSSRDNASVVWSGAEMIVWGGLDPALTSLSDGASYDPLADTWRPVTTTTLAVVGHSSHTAVWTGTEMIIWGGGCCGFTTRGARYDPATNSWRQIALSNSPTNRTGHTAVWTGTQMIIWGGDKHVSGDSLTNSGARYDPSTNSWGPTTTVDSPSPRSGHTAIWTGSEMIVWGGVDTSGLAVSSGGRYNPVTDKWSPLDATGAPPARAGHTSVWTGSSMIVWGGSSLNTGGSLIP